MNDGRWHVGEAEIENLIDDGELEEIEPSPEHAALLLRQANAHLASAPALLPADPTGAFAPALRRRTQGHQCRARPTRTSSRQEERIPRHPRSTRGPARPQRPQGRPFRSLRIRRHDAEYPSLDTPEVTENEVNEALQDARDILDAMKTFLPNLGPWRG